MQKLKFLFRFGILFRYNTTEYITRLYIVQIQPVIAPILIFNAYGFKLKALEFLDCEKTNLQDSFIHHPHMTSL